MVGVYCVIVARSVLEQVPTQLRIPREVMDTIQVVFPAEVGRVLRPIIGKPPRPLVARSCCLALTLWHEATPIEQLLQIDNYRDDCLDVYAAAFAAMMVLKGHEPEYYPETLEAVKQDLSFNAEDFRTLQLRFVRSIMFWCPSMAVKYQEHFSESLMFQVLT